MGIPGILSIQELSNLYERLEYREPHGLERAELKRLAVTVEEWCLRHAPEKKLHSHVERGCALLRKYKLFKEIDTLFHQAVDGPDTFENELYLEVCRKTLLLVHKNELTRSQERVLRGPLYYAIRVRKVLSGFASEVLLEESREFLEVKQTFQRLLTSSTSRKEDFRSLCNDLTVLMFGVSCQKADCIQSKKREELRLLMIRINTLDLNVKEAEGTFDKAKELESKIVFDPKIRGCPELSQEDLVGLIEKRACLLDYDYLPVYVRNKLEGSVEFYLNRAQTLSKSTSVSHIPSDDRERGSPRRTQSLGLPN